MAVAPPPGWYPDPSTANQQRWWDGSVWSHHVQPQVHAPATPLLPPPAVPQASPRTSRRLPTWVWITCALTVVVLATLLPEVLMMICLIVLITGIVSLVKGTPTWLHMKNRKVATLVTAVATVGLLIASSLSTAKLEDQLSSIGMTATSTPAAVEPSTTPTPTSTLEVSTADEDDAVVAFAGSTETVADSNATTGLTAAEVLATLPIKGRAAKTGYDRAAFGQRWLDVDRNGCDTRNDILAAQLMEVTRQGPCKVISGTLDDPFTGSVIAFERGQGTSELVQIDHVVALSDAWQKGAQQLTADQRATFANDPLNLLAVDGTANAQKGDGDAATWLPKHKAFRCEYVARQVAVKATYGLWVTQAEHDAIARVLVDCPDEPAPTSTFVPSAPEPIAETTPAPDGSSGPVPFMPTTPTKDTEADSATTPPKSTTPKGTPPVSETKPAPAPKPAPPAPKPAPAPPTDVTYKNCDAVRAAGAAPIHVGEPGYSRKLDRDGDGIGCE